MENPPLLKMQPSELLIFKITAGLKSCLKNAQSVLCAGDEPRPFFNVNFDCLVDTLSV